MAMRTLWTAAPVARVLGRGGAASASTSARGGEDLESRRDGTIDEDAPFVDAGAPRVGRVDAWRELGFSSAREMREQHGSDFHRHNRRRLNAGRAPVTEAEFEAMLRDDGDVSSISGSDSDTDSDTDSDEDGASDIGSTSASFRASRGAGEGNQTVIEGLDGSKYGVWSCLVAPPGKEKKYVDDAAAQNSALLELRRIKDENKPWVVVLARGGHFAASAFEPGKFFSPKGKDKSGDDASASEPTPSRASERFLTELVPASAAAAHKTFHRYVVRAKAGGRQSGKDGGGKTIKSAGSSVRRANEAALEKEIKDLFRDDEKWRSILQSAALIFVSASKTDERTLFVGADAPLRRDDFRVRRVPFATKRPTFNETRRVVGKLALVNFEIEEIPIVATTMRETETKTESLSAAQAARLEAAKARAAEAAAALGGFGMNDEGDVTEEEDSNVTDASASYPASLSKKEKEKLKKRRAKERARLADAAKKPAETEGTTEPRATPPPDLPTAGRSSGGGKGGKAAALLAKARQSQTAKRDEAALAAERRQACLDAAQRRTAAVVASTHSGSFGIGGGSHSIAGGKNGVD